MAPLFSIRTEENFGIGEILDIIPLIDWMADHELRVLQLLPMLECAPGETSPYQALSSFACDPVYLSILNWKDFQNRAIFADLDSDATQQELAVLRGQPLVCYERIRTLKNRLFEYAFTSFKKKEWQVQSRAALDLQSFIDTKSHWLRDYALFRVIKEQHRWTSWLDWPEALRTRDSEALERFSAENGDRLLFIYYLQWLFWKQWRRVRAHAASRHVLLMGDLPFLPAIDSADLWSQAELFDTDISIGAPPDDFSETGQDWGLPFFRWEMMQAKGFRWWRSRISEARASFDLLRLDHLLGFFRVWVMPSRGEAHFEPDTDAAQIVRGETLLQALLGEMDECIPIAEDLGLVPSYMTRILNRIGIAGMKVLRWEKEGAVYKDPRDYPFLSMATTGTHDTATLREWWESAETEDKQGFLEMLGETEDFSPAIPFTQDLHRRILECLIGSDSALVVFPIQDILGQTDRINVPATIGGDNWRYRLPFPFSILDRHPAYREKMAALKAAIQRHRPGAHRT